MVPETIPLFSTVNNEDIEASIVNVLRSGAIASGENIALFEKQLSKKLGFEDLITLTDMTSAIYMALLLSGVEKGDKVLTTSFSCLATTSAIAQLGAEPIWVDIEPDSLSFSCDDAAHKVCSKTKAVLLYHLAGYPADTKRVYEFCQSNNLKLVEDCNNAMFAKNGSNYVGSFGDYSIFSFYPNRQINGIEGGALYCKRSDERDRVRRLRRYGIDPTNFRDSSGEIRADLDIKEHGWSLTMNNLNCGVALTQLPDAERKVERARYNAMRLTSELVGINNLQLVVPTCDSLPAYWVLLALVENRDNILVELKKQGVMVSKLHQCNDKYSFFGDPQSSFELINTREMEEKIIAFPIGWWLSESTLEVMTDKIKFVLNKYAR